jgi:hypothetical protein
MKNSTSGTTKNNILKAVLWSGMFYSGSRIRISKFFIPDPGGKKAPDPIVHKKRDEK